VNDQHPPQRYHVDVRLVSVATLIGYVAVLAAHPEEAAALARKEVEANRVTIMRREPENIVAFELSEVRPVAPWDGSERRRERAR
jgi:hypothetical protein